MLCGPGGNAPVKSAWAFSFRVTEARFVVPSRKVTVPVGVAVDGETALTVTPKGVPGPPGIPIAVVVAARSAVRFKPEDTVLVLAARLAVGITAADILAAPVEAPCSAPDRR